MLYESIFKEESYMFAWYTKVAHCVPYDFIYPGKKYLDFAFGVYFH